MALRGREGTKFPAHPNCQPEPEIQTLVRNLQLVNVSSKFPFLLNTLGTEQSTSVRGGGPRHPFLHGSWKRIATP